MHACMCAYRQTDRQPDRHTHTILKTVIVVVIILLSSVSMASVRPVHRAEDNTDLWQARLSG